MKRHFAFFDRIVFHLAISCFGEIVVITLNIGKTLNNFDLVI